ncbi:2-dehydro-3-deoxygalactonokinase [Zophobihabitans entericus]|uniref:2-dehydro-3-deoxygalactonokinase n=1 Tax=Zophobihabitans entericus TaxID=1635327 RepID=A0A6G9ID49_9GAMM|nr:2-dehydro-3-deoxygalactonokinase [Zophobihabitans entericus]QIQ21739.1 2-dehydro-3-deoxygalactonokinase [Zophobihabitans entericus]
MSEILPIVTIDSGTTNTRVRVWSEQKVIAEATQSVGVRDTAITGNTIKLKQAVKTALDEALLTAKIKPEQPLLILACGMITSNLGLCEIPHLVTPVSMKDLAANMVKKLLPEISSSPVWFIPGVKNSANPISLDDCEMMDIMRGEETETIGVLSLSDINSPALIVLPGSHSKFVKIDQQKNITACTTTIAGEMLDIITQQTIISGSLDHQFAKSIDQDYLLKGAASCQDVGLARSCFLVRLLDLFGQTTINQRANYLLGAVLYGDLLTIKQSQALNVEADTTIILTGKKILQQALQLLISHDDFFTGKIIELNEQKEQPLSGLGSIALAKIANLLSEKEISQ